MTENVIGVVGGVGPYAGLDLVRKILDQTIARTDQDHLAIALLSYSAMISDRTNFVLGHTSQNPANGIILVLRQLEQLGAGVVGIPCNTAHAPMVFDKIRADLSARKSPLLILHMLEETARFLRLCHPGVARVGVLSTTGTQRARIYPQFLEEENITVLTPCEETQQEVVNAAIYDSEYGIKAKSNPVTERARVSLIDAATELVESGSEIIILGCTEIPLALPEKTIESIPLVDPTLILARALVHAVAPHKLRPLS